MFMESDWWPGFCRSGRPNQNIIRYVIYGKVHTQRDGHGIMQIYDRRWHNPQILMQAIRKQRATSNRPLQTQSRRRLRCIGLHQVLSIDVLYLFSEERSLRAASAAVLRSLNLGKLVDEGTTTAAFYIVDYVWPEEFHLVSSCSQGRRNTNYLLYFMAWRDAVDKHEEALQNSEASPSSTWNMNYRKGVVEMLQQACGLDGVCHSLCTWLGYIYFL